MQEHDPSSRIVYLLVRIDYNNPFKEYIVGAALTYEDANHWLDKKVSCNSLGKCIRRVFLYNRNEEEGIYVL